MASGRSTITASVATEARNCLRPGRFHPLAGFSQAETRKRLCFLPTSGVLFPRPYHCHRSDYVSARAEARSNSNVGQGHAGAVAFNRFRFIAVP